RRAPLRPCERLGRPEPRGGPRPPAGRRRHGAGGRNKQRSPPGPTDPGPLPGRRASRWYNRAPERGERAMALLTVRLYGDPALRQPGKPVEAVTPEIAQMLDDMIETMYQEVGVGLAA